jgi:hypothetical protein
MLVFMREVVVVIFVGNHNMASTLHTLIRVTRRLSDLRKRSSRAPRLPAHTLHTP